MLIALASFSAPSTRAPAVARQPATAMAISRRAGGGGASWPGRGGEAPIWGAWAVVRRAYADRRPAGRGAACPPPAERMLPTARGGAIGSDGAQGNRRESVTP